MSHTDVASTHFDRTTTVRRVTPDRNAAPSREAVRRDATTPDGGIDFVAELDESWASLRGVHGGYVTALAVRAAESVAPGRAVRTVTSSFLRPTETGPIDIHLDVIRSGRSFGTVAATFAQHDRTVITTRITMLTPTVGRDWSTVATDRPAAREACVAFAPPPSIRHFAQAELRIDPATIPTGEAEDSRIAGHVRPNECRSFDAAWLTMIGDWFPPSPFRRHQPPTGGVSIDYTVHIHRTLAADADLWLEGVFDARTSLDGIALEHGVLSTPGGQAVAETFHTRWTA